MQSLRHLICFCHSGLHQVYALADQLSTTLQCTECSDITATRAKKCAEVTCSAVQRFRSDAAFSSFWEKIAQQAPELQLTDPVFRECVDLLKNCNLAQRHIHSVPRKIIVV